MQLTTAAILKQQAPGKVRIVAGKWRGRKLSVLNAEGLRPTSDRVRETLFNWLQKRIADSQCLDLFAGTGALGFEAASRGAAFVQLVENNPAVAQQLDDNITTLGAENIALHHGDALEWLVRNSQKFDLVFLDPPFKQGLLDQCCSLLAETQTLKQGGLVYLEADKKTPLPKRLDIIKQSRAGQVNYLLAELL